MKLIKFIIFITVITIIAGLAPSASAAGLDLGVDPAILEIEANPPANIQAQIAIENFGDSPIELTISFKPFKPAEFSLRPEILEDNKVVDSVSLAAGQKKKLMLRVNVGQNKPASDYYFSIIFISKPKLSNQKTETVTSGGVSTNVLLSIGTKGKAKGEIVEFSSPFFVNKGPLPITLRVKNIGDHFITPKGGILIENMYGQTVGRVDLSPVNVLANSTRRADLVWDEKFLLGPYKATLTLALSDEGPVFSRTIRFVALPWQAILGLIVLLLVILIVVSRVRSKLKS